ncbi:MAG TPA: glycosyltransferase family 4 protein, partial [Acetobacteraceae bacterium]|nr:glycosyltransferase family 4 protein [Acetobacteraceae bacterium]
AIQARLPEVQLVVAGSNPPPDVQALNDRQITIRANVSSGELHELYRNARVAIAPLRYGAGVKFKVVEALHEGLPLVTTSIGAQGLPGIADILPVCDEPVAFADAVCRLLTDEIAWAECATAQVGYASTHYSETAFRNSLQQALVQSASRCAARCASYSALAAVT